MQFLFTFKHFFFLSDKKALLILRICSGCHAFSPLLTAFSSMEQELW